MIPLYDDNPTRRPPYITLALIALNVVVYFFVQPHDTVRHETNFLFERAAVPCEVMTGHPVEAVAGQPTCDAPDRPPVFPGKNVYVAIILSMFLHANLLHIGGNMLFLWIFGNNVEDEMGHILFAVFYLVGGIAAAFTHILIFRGSAVPIIGASGAIAAVMGAYLVRFPRARVLTLVTIIPLRLPAWIVLGVWFVGQFGISAAESGVASAAHIGGFVFGLLVALVFGLTPRRRAPAPYF